MTRILIAGVGNVLRGDDGFGVRALERLQAGRFGSHEAVRFFESGTAGISLVQELMGGFETLVVLDAVDRGGAPGELFVIQPDLSNLGDASVDLHEAGPLGVLRVAAGAGVLPKEAFVVGAQMVSCDELGAELSAPVQAGLDEAVRRVEAILDSRLAPDVAFVDEILQILYWLRGEGLAEEITPESLERWLTKEGSSIEPALRRMAELGLVEATESSRFRLTPEGRREGGRRFAEEFSGLTKPGHGECGDPECECMTTGDPADCRHHLL